MAAIRRGEPLIAPAEEGIHSVELANAISESSLAGRTIELPLNAAAYARRLKGLVAASKPRKKSPRTRKVVDLSKSFN